MTDRRTTRRRALAAGGAALGAAATAGCLGGITGGESTPTPLPPEATVTVRLRNRDDVSREYEVVVRHGGEVGERFSGVLPPDTEQYVEMTATFRATDGEHSFSVETAGGQRGRTWSPTECGDFLVKASVESGEPRFDARCRVERTT